MRAVKFTFEGSPEFDGFAQGTTWNGLDNVSITPEERERIAKWFEDGGDTDTAELLREHPVEENGLLDLSGGYATQIMPDRSEQISQEMRDALAEISPDWEDSSWGNDACDSFENDALRLKLWCDYVNPEHREIDGARFTVCRMDENGQSEHPALLATEEWSEVVDFLKLQHANVPGFN